MKKKLLFSTIIILLTKLLFSQEFKHDNRTQMDKENALDHNVNETTILDILDALESQGIRINKFKFGTFDKRYDIYLLYDVYNDGIITKKDTLCFFENTYRHYESDESYFDFIDHIKIVTKDSLSKSKLTIKTYSFLLRKDIELTKIHKKAFFIWRRYSDTKWKLNEKIPLMIYASSWTDKKLGIERFCGIPSLTKNGKYTNDLLSLSPNYIMIYYIVTDKK